MQKRIDYIDTAKGLLIILVIFGHALLFNVSDCTKQYYFILKVIYSFHMAAFLILSGIVFNITKWCSLSCLLFIKTKIYRIIIPYIFFEIGGVFFQYIFKWEETGSFKHILWNIVTLKTYVGADWFLPTYFMAELLCLMCFKYFRKIVKIIIYLPYILITFIPQCNNRFAEIILRVLICTSLILVGCIWKEFFVIQKTILYDFVSVIILLFCALKNEIVFLHIPRVGNVMLFILGAISGTYFVIKVSQRISSKMLLYLGRNTIAIMGTHQNIELAIAYYFGTYASFGFILFYFFVMFLGELLIIPLLNIVFPFLIGRK